MIAGGHVRADSQPHQVVRDVAVEDRRRGNAGRRRSRSSFRQKIVCVVTTPAGMTAAMSVSRFDAEATSR